MDKNIIALDGYISWCDKALTKIVGKIKSLEIMMDKNKLKKGKQFDLCSNLVVQRKSVQDIKATCRELLNRI